MYVDLPWADLDPRGRQFDDAPVRTAVAAVVRGYAVPFDSLYTDREQIEAAIDRAILESAGRWACGWRWSPSEPGGGRPGSRLVLCCALGAR